MKWLKQALLIVGTFIVTFYVVTLFVAALTSACGD